MLGRLFKNTPSNPPYQGNHNSYEDPYTREILYATHNSNQLKSTQVSTRLFRMIIAQDGGNLRLKQVLFDSEGPHNQSYSHTGQTQSTQAPQTTHAATHNQSFKHTQNKSIVNSRAHHHTSDLNDYMFGCGLPTNETDSATKIHVLPTLQSLTYGSYHSILVTRLFSITDSETDVSFPDQDWNPSPTLPIKESPVRLRSACSINSRFSIGIVIPLVSLDDINDVIFTNWEEISHYLILLQKMVVKRMVAVLEDSSKAPLHAPPQYSSSYNSTATSAYASSYNQGVHSNQSLQASHNHTSPYIVNKRIQFPSYILQNETEINSQIPKLLKLLHYINVPRLFNSNPLIKMAATQNKYNSLLLNWVLEVMNWLEFKDGRTTARTSFLASLFAILIPIRETLSRKPYYYESGPSRELTRVVVMTGNPVVAKKLIFIVNALIPNNLFDCEAEAAEAVNNASLGNLNKVRVARPNERIRNSESSKSLNPNRPHLSSIQDVETKRRQGSDTASTNTSAAHMNINRNGLSPIDINASIDEITSTDTSEKDYTGADFASRDISPPEEGVKSESNSGSPLMSSDSSVNPSTSRILNKSSISKTTNPVTDSFPISIANTAIVVPTPIPLNITKPIPIKASNASSSTSSDGWEIPSKSSATSHMEGIPISKGIPIRPAMSTLSMSRDPTNSVTASSVLSKSSSMSYLSSSLNSSLSSSASNYSLTKLGGSFMEKWRNSFGSSGGFPANSVNSIGGGSVGFSGNSSAGAFGCAIPATTPDEHPSLSQRNSVQSLRSPSPAMESEDFQWQHVSEFPPESAKLSRTQSMFDLYSNGPGGSFNLVSENSTQEENRHLEVKRTKNSLFVPLVDDSIIKNVGEHNRAVIRKKCSKIMSRIPVTSTEGDTMIVEGESEEVFDSEDEVGSLEVDDPSDTSSLLENFDFTTDQQTITSKAAIGSIQSDSESESENEDGSGSTEPYTPVRSHGIFKHKPLLPDVAFSDEFRPEYNIQSCPINPKLENQVMTAMKNDLLFYQNNFNYSNILTRTVFISLRAREIKLIEMSIDNSSSASATGTRSASDSPEDPSYFSHHHHSSPAAQSTPLTPSARSSYKTRIKKVYIPTRNTGNHESILGIERVFEQMNQLLASQQQQQHKARGNESLKHEAVNGGNEFPPAYDDFTRRLSSLVLSLMG